MTNEAIEAAALLPCPFCGGNEITATPPPYPWGFKCAGCQAEVTLADTEAEAIAAWNTRFANRPVAANLVAVSEAANSSSNAIEAAARAILLAETEDDMGLLCDQLTEWEAYHAARAAAPALMEEGARLALEAAANCPHGTDGPDDGDCAFVLRQAIRALDPAAIVKGAGHE